jgi:hypothetical protein
MNEQRQKMNEIFCGEMKLKETECKRIHAVIKKRKKRKEKIFMISKAIE